MTTAEAGQRCAREIWQKFDRLSPGRIDRVGEIISAAMAEREKPILDVYEAHKHLDYLLSDREWVGDDIRLNIIRDLWAVIKAVADEKK